MADLYYLSNWKKHSPITLPPTADKWRSFPTKLQSRLLKVSWSVPQLPIKQNSITGYIETLVSTPLGELPPEITSIPIDIKPIVYRLVRVPAAGFDYQLKFKADNSKLATTLTIWEFIPDIPTPAMAPSHNPPPAIPPANFAGVETRLDSLITATGQNAAAIGQLSSQIAAPETSVDSKTYRFKLIPWTGNPDDHKLLDRALRRFVKMTAETAMTNGDRILIATGRDGRDSLPGPDGWQYNYTIHPGGYYDSEEEDAGQEFFAWLPQGNPTTPIEVTLTEGL
jgi:hypothetical protein